MRGAAPDAGSARHWRGLLLGLAVACSFAANSALARMAYEGGSNPLSVLTVRTAFALLALYVLLVLARVPRRLPRPRRHAALALGIPLAVYSYGLLGAVERIPVALAVVTFYVYPLLVALGSWLLGRERIGARTACGLLGAFAGLVLALDPAGAVPDRAGVALALAGAVVFAVMLLASDRLRGDGDSRPITLHMLLLALGAYLGACLLSGGFALPVSPAGWVGFAGGPLFYAFSIISLFVVVRLVGPVRSALLLNVEPVASVVLGYLLLHQQLGALQLLGIALVVGSVAAVRAAGLRRAGPPGGARKVP